MSARLATAPESRRSTEPDITPLHPLSASTSAPPSASTPTLSSPKTSQPTIRFIPHIEPRNPRPSLSFEAISRTLTKTNSIVRVGRYSERDIALATQENAQLGANEVAILPVGFKSKVVSRRHCEFWQTSGQWYVKDVKSSSGTFLNHVRLSSPGTESRAFPVNDGDVVQLGIDFKGGEEIIFRCVKIRVECNRNWQKSLNSFNREATKRLLQSRQHFQPSNGKNNTNIPDNPSPSTSQNPGPTPRRADSSECSICLNPIAPCQALFVAPCSHVWHYKCISAVIQGSHWPHFSCPNCRLVADLEADVEAPEEWEVLMRDMTLEEEVLTSEADEVQKQQDEEERADGPLGTELQEESLAQVLTLNEFARVLEKRWPDRSFDAIPDDEIGALLKQFSRSRGTEDLDRETTRLDALGDFHTAAGASNGVAAPASQPLDIQSNSTRTPNGSETTDQLRGDLEDDADVDADALSPRSATPVSNEQFALAAGLGQMDPRSQGKRVVAPSAGISAEAHIGGSGAGLQAES